MDAIDKALEDALARQREGSVRVAATARRAAAVPAAKSAAVDPWSPEAILRAANEDDDLYDPYSDYMDALARSSYEEPEEDPWR